MAKFHPLVRLPTEPLPQGSYLVHTDVKSPKGFRAYVADANPGNIMIECKCDFGGLKNADKHNKHYRFAA